MGLGIGESRCKYWGEVLGVCGSTTTTSPTSELVMEQVESREVAVAAAAAAVVNGVVPGQKRRVGPINPELHTGQRLKMMSAPHPLVIFAKVITGCLLVKPFLRRSWLTSLIL